MPDVWLACIYPSGKPEAADALDSTAHPPLHHAIKCLMVVGGITVGVRAYKLVITGNIPKLSVGRKAIVLPRFYFQYQIYQGVVFLYDTPGFSDGRPDIRCAANKEVVCIRKQFRQSAFPKGVDANLVS